RHHAVLRGGANPDAELSVFQEQPETADDDRRQYRDDDRVPGILQVEQSEVAADRLGDFARHGAELPERVVLQDQRYAERDQDRVERIAPDQRAQRHDLQRRAEDGDNDRGNDQAQ